MIDYCKSDVALLKAGCEAFHQKIPIPGWLQPHGQVYDHCQRLQFVLAKTLPTTRYHRRRTGPWLAGANVNHSLNAVQWLYYQEQQISKQGACEDRIRYVRNGGEQSVRTAVTSSFVDEYDALTRTIFEFHGCLYHGCPTCFSRDRRQKLCHS